MIEWLQEGGWAAWVVLFLSLPALSLAVVHAAFAETWSLVVSAAFVVLVLLAGGAGTLHGRATTDSALAAVAPELAERIREEGYRESSHPILLALPVALAAAVPLAIGEVRRRRRRA